MSSEKFSKNSDALIATENLKVSIGQVDIIRGVNFSMKKNEIVAVVGESGSGKSTLASALVGLVGDNNKNVRVEGDIKFEGKSLRELSLTQWREIRGKDIAVILQDPMSSLNPVFNIGAQLAEALRAHIRASSADVKNKVIDVLGKVHIPSPEKRLKTYPHQLSGGMRQRVVGAMGIIGSPKLLIADEPTTSLDASLQAQYLQLLKELQNEAAGSDRPMSILLITHDFGAVAKLCDRVCVMYAGRLVEVADVFTIFDKPAHPYTKSLLASRPHLSERGERMPTIKGAPPKAGDAISGCAFASRCEFATDKCRKETPKADIIVGDHVVACWHPLNTPNAGVANHAEGAV